MLGIPLRYLLKHPVLAVADLAADPLEIWTTIHDSYVAQREQRRPQYRYESDDNWEQRLHEALGVPWQCNATAEFWNLFPEVINELEAKGIRAGPESFQWWNDGDAGLGEGHMVSHSSLEAEKGCRNRGRSRCYLALYSGGA
jgi:hypothetical protein